MSTQNKKNASTHPNTPLSHARRHPPPPPNTHTHTHTHTHTNTHIHRSMQESTYRPVRESSPADSYATRTSASNNERRASLGIEPPVRGGLGAGGVGGPSLYNSLGSLSSAPTASISSASFAGPRCVCVCVCVRACVSESVSLSLSLCIYTHTYIVYIDV